MQNYTNINSKLYSELFELGGDNLVSVYAILKFAKNGAIKIYKEENRNIFHTLKTKTNLSITTLRKYIKILSKEGLCHFDKAGNFVLKGNNKLNKQYNSKKAVPIEIGSFRETKLFSFRVRIKKMEQQQKRRIDRRSEQGKIIGKMKKGYALSKSQFNFRKAWNDKDLEYSQNSESFNANTVLSNEGFSKLKFGELKSKSSGNYWKKKLVEAGVIKTKRQFEFLKRCSQKEYLSLRYSGFRNLVFKNGKLYKETVSKFTTTEFYKPKEEIKELKHLSFDFCFFLAQQ